jgi:hypothetical protein
MAAQSLLFDRSAGWTAVKAKAWAKSHGYLYGKVDVTDQYIRIRQFDPKGFKVKRTIPFGRGIRAVVAREESMRTTTAKEAPRRRRSSKKKATASKRPRRRARKAAAVTTRRRRRKVQAAKRSSHMMEASKRRRTKRRPARAAEAWKGDSAGHAKAARKGHRRSKARKARKAGRRRSKKTRETMYAAAPRRRRHAKRTREPMVMEAKKHRTRRRYHAHAAKSRSGGMSPAEFGLAIVSAGFGFVLADGLDRMLATYDPTAATKPTDKFTSDGAGTLANTLNVASTPDWKRLVAGIGMTAVPAVGSMYVKNPLLKSSAEGLAIGAGVSLFKTLWSNVLMPLLVGKDTTTPALQKSYIARLYPAEVAAHINSRKTNDAGAAVTPQMAVSSAGSGALSGAPAQQAPSYPAPGLGAPALDVGPFALAGSSDYPSAAEALRAAAGVGASASGGLLPTASQAMGMGASASGGLLPTVAQTLGASAAGGLLPTASQAMGMGTPYMPGPPPGPGPGPQIERGADPAACGCIGDDNQFLGFVGDEAADGTLASSSMT